MNKNNNKKGYVSKRLKCEYCEKKFNKKDTFDKHVNENHKISSSLRISQELELNVQFIKFYRDGRSGFLYQLHWKVQCVTSNVIQQEWPALG